MHPLYTAAIVACACVLLMGLGWLLQFNIYDRWENGWRRCQNCQRWHNKKGEIRHLIPIEEFNPKYVWTLCPKCNRENQNQ